MAKIQKRRRRVKVNTNCGPAVIKRHKHKPEIGSWWRYGSGSHVIRVNNASECVQWMGAYGWRVRPNWLARDLLHGHHRITEGEARNIVETCSGEITNGWTTLPPLPVVKVEIGSLWRWCKLLQVVRVESDTKVRIVTAFGSWLSDRDEYDFGFSGWRQINNTTAVEIVGREAWAKCPPLPLPDGITNGPAPKKPERRDTVATPLLSNQSKSLHNDLHLAVRWFESLAKRGMPSAIELDIMQMVVVGVLNRLGSLDAALKQQEMQESMKAVADDAAKGMVEALAREIDTELLGCCGPFSWRADVSGYRVADGHDNRIATCFVQENAKLIVKCLNQRDAIGNLCELAEDAMVSASEDGGLTKQTRELVEKWRDQYDAMLKKCQSQAKS